ncbi:hypothetical protein M2347_001969 [Chryseobacterium sp. H1D6B]|uniref:carboxypeptidase-like regulatory domain-containing protein n=1 Tax=Chryseobacterium sp. H1D6B TaxID=2940588 RepID=UPI0015C6A60B|nr:carboxypeptidase-like regulatory domain-containing protein [Chryseobacterium sp. H1D6B]MDH6252242.1 hypothetical protein [Chryseobacterium sp. H1D6B]
MKKTVLLSLILFPFYFFFAQIIKGKVVNDAEIPISNVNIYLDGTKIGTTSKEDGSFALELSSKNTGNLVFQKENYETFTTETSKVSNKTLKVVLIKVNEIEEVKIIPYTEETYKNFINYFLDNFIGSDQQHVKIKNQRSLKFSYDKQNKLLKVKAPQPLLIENKNLGYIIEYNLVTFSADFNAKMFTYTGTSFFKESKQSDKVKLNRMNAYEGSMMHFLRSIFTNKTASEGFVVNRVIKIPNPKYPTDEELEKIKDYFKMTAKSKVISLPQDILDISRRKNNESPYVMAIAKTQIPESDYTKTEDGKMILTFKDILQVNYKKFFFDLKNKKFTKSSTLVVQTSFLHPEGETFEIYESGNISNPDLLINQGDFSKNKIENMLPLDYELGD